MDLGAVRVRPVERCEEGLYQELMQAHHYLGAVPKIGETLWYVASYHGAWVALLSFSAAAWKCAVRDPHGTSPWAEGLTDWVGFPPPL